MIPFRLVTKSIGLNVFASHAKEWEDGPSKLGLELRICKGFSVHGTLTFPHKQNILRIYILLPSVLYLLPTYGILFKSIPVMSTGLPVSETRVLAIASHVGTRRPAFAPTNLAG